MNRISELEAQNLQDSWSILYLALADQLLRRSEEGERQLRQAVRTYGRTVGQAERSGHQREHIQVNLDNFYNRPQHRFYDPRLFTETQRLNEQVALINVIRCPFALCARRYCQEGPAKIFCEEYTPACIDTYTGGVSQTNLSEVLPDPRDTHCRIPAYFRPGNGPHAPFQTSFSQFQETVREPEAAGLPLTEAKRVWQESACWLLEAFCQTDQAAQWMPKTAAPAAERLAEFLRERAKSMEQTLDQGFVERNCALPTRTALPEPCSAFGAQLLRQLGINEEV